MQFDRLKQIRLLHMLVISAFIIIILVQDLRESIPYWEFLLAFGYMICWVMGIRYERQVIIRSGIAKPAELRIAERNAASWIFQVRDPEDPRN